MTRQTLQTQRLVLRPFTLDDASAVTAILRDAEVSRWMSATPWPYPDGAAEEYIRTQCSEAAEQQTLNRAIVCDGAYIGCVGLKRAPEHQRAYLGYYIGQRWWGRGFATEAVERIVQFAFEELACVRLDSSCCKNNIGSANVLRKVGFRYEGSRRCRFLRHDVWHDESLFGLLAADRTADGGGKLDV